jgi:GT2 family glycosyltransferase
MNRPSRPSLVSVIIPTRNRTGELRRCLNSVQKSSYRQIEVVVVDDASIKPVESVLADNFPTVKFVRNERRAFLSCSRNSGAKAAEGDYLFFLDDDNVIAPDAIEELIRPFSTSEKTGVSAPIIYYMAEPEEVWTSYVVRGRFPGFYTLRTDVPKVYKETFSFHNSFMVKRSVFEEMEGFDCANFPIRFSELEFSHRLRAKGFTALVNPKAWVWHDIGWALVHVDKARAYYTERNRMLLLKRYYPRGDFIFYATCILPFLGSYYLIHHSLSSSDSPLQTAASLLRGIVDGLRLPPVELSRAERL